MSTQSSGLSPLFRFFSTLSRRMSALSHDVRSIARIVTLFRFIHSFTRNVNSFPIFLPLFFTRNVSPFSRCPLNRPDCQLFSDFSPLFHAECQRLFPMSAQSPGLSTLFRFISTLSHAMSAPFPDVRSIARIVTPFPIYLHSFTRNVSPFRKNLPRLHSKERKNTH